MNVSSNKLEQKRVLVLTDMSSIGSGYRYICTPLLTELAALGYDIKVLGLLYEGEENNHPFSLIPTADFRDAVFMIKNFEVLWPYDVLVIALDISHHKFMLSEFARFRPPIEPKYIAITPLENGPMLSSWVAELYKTDWVFFISELGAKEAKKAGLEKCSHLQVGINTDDWYPVDAAKKAQMRDAMGIGQDEFVVLTVAENQERKNLWASFDALSQVKKRTNKKLRYMLVTREHNVVGYDLRAFAQTYDLVDELHILERGIPQETLSSLYQLADIFLLTSKAEGLGIPVLESLASNLPVVGTDTGAITESLMDGRGYLVPPEYSMIDPWGNSRRDMIDRKALADTILDIIQNGVHIKGAREYALSRTWDIPAKQLADKIEELTNVKEQKTNEPTKEKD